MRKFTIIWAGQTASALATRITQFAFTLWLFERTQKATSLALFGFIYGISSVLINLLAGYFVDRYNRKKLIMLTDSLNGCVAITYFILFLSGHLQIWHIYLGAAAQGGLDVLQSLAYESSISMMVAKKHYVRTSSMTWLTNYAGAILGPGLGAFFYGTIGIAGVLVIDFVTLLLALATIFLNEIPQPPRATRIPQNFRQIARQARQDFAFGLQHIRKHAGLKTLLILVFFHVTFDGSANVFLPAMVLTITNQDQNLYALVGIASGIGGALMAGLLTVTGGARKNRIQVSLLGMAAAGFWKTAFTTLRPVSGWLIARGFASSNFPLIHSNLQAIWMEAIKPEQQGRVFAARNIIYGFGFWVGYGIAGPIGDLVLEPAVTKVPAILGSLIGTGPGSGFALGLALAGLGMFLVGIAGFFLPKLRALN